MCIGSRSGRTLVWRFDLAAAPAAPLAIPGVARRSGVGRDGRLVALWTPGEMLVVDLDFARANRWTMPDPAGYPVDIVPAADRLVVFSRSGAGARIEVCDARW